jgi:hypothetical protein
MNLTTEDGTTIREPSSDDLQSALGRLGLPGNGFAILGTSPEHYIQVAGSKAGGYVVEYREGCESTHHSSKVSDLPHGQMVDLLTAYLRGGSWKPMLQWQSGFHTQQSARRPSTLHKTAVILFFAIGAMSLALSAYFFYATQQFLARAVEVPGQVVKLVGRGTTYAPVVDYVDLHGQKRTLYSNQGSSPPSFFQGQEVTVLYDPEDPEFPLTAKVSSFGQLWGASLFALVFGAAFAGIALAHWLLLFRRRP